jgi:hypothetical protein
MRKLGVTVRKTTDAVIAFYWITNAAPLLYADRDFDPFVEHLRLERA